jgi:GT2 family glycosyltransferase
MTVPLVSVCIAHYNGIELIDACIASVCAQAGDISFEIIVHDDASSDGSANHIRSQHADVRLVASHENVGFCVANNRMAAMAQGQYLLLLNNDATLLPDALQTLLAEATRLGRPAILTLPQYDAATGELLDIGSRLDPFLNPVPNCDPACGEVGTVHGACLWLPRALWQELGGFPEWFGSVGEDLYLCCRARLAGHPVRALGISGYRHRVGQSFGGGKARGGKLATTFRRRALSERNKTFVMALTYPAPFMQFALPLHLLILLIEGGLLSILNGRLAYLREIYLPVFVAMFRQRKLLVNNRRSIMAGRRLASTDYFSVFTLLPHKLRMLLRYGLPKVA